MKYLGKFTQVIAVIKSSFYTLISVMCSHLEFNQLWCNKLLEIHYTLVIWFGFFCLLIRREIDEISNWKRFDCVITNYPSVNNLITSVNSIALTTHLPAVVIGNQTRRSGWNITIMWQSLVENEHYSIAISIVSLYSKCDISERPLRAGLKHDM